MLVRRRSSITSGGPRVAAAVRDALRAEEVEPGLLVAAGDGPLGAAGRLVVRIGEDETVFEASTPADVPYFGWFVAPVVALSLRRLTRHAESRVRAELEGLPPPAAPRAVPFAPPAPFEAQQVVMIATLAAVTAVVGFSSSLFGQYVQFVAVAFGADDPALGFALALTRFGVVVALVAAWLADRRGRRLLLLSSLVGLALASLASGLAPSLAAFTGAQLLVRGFANAAAVVGVVMAVEEAPEGARAYTIGMLTLAGGAGYAAGTALLPVADLGPDLWRLPFVLAALSLLLLPSFTRRMRESHRWVAVAARHVRRGRAGEVVEREYGRRFASLVLVVFVLAASSTPLSQLTNRYLGDVRGFSGLGVTVFMGVTTVAPFLVGIATGGRMTETRGRRLVAAVALVGSAVTQAAFFLASGPVMWFASAIATFFGGFGAPALGALSTELFPTEVRGTANGLLLVAGVAGSATGLVAAGALAAPLGGLGPSLALMGATAALVVTLLPWLPEAAFRRLDEVSPSRA